MSPSFAVFILMNNYFHDVATAMLLASAIAMRLILRVFQSSNDPGSLGMVRTLAKNVVRIVWFSVAWIVVSGVVRILTFNSFEWANAVQTHHESGLIAKYIIAIAMMAVGAWWWSGLLRDMLRQGIIDRTRS